MNTHTAAVAVQKVLLPFFAGEQRGPKVRNKNAFAPEISNEELVMPLWSDKIQALWGDVTAVKTL